MRQPLRRYHSYIGMPILPILVSRDKSSVYAALISNNRYTTSSYNTLNKVATNLTARYSLPAKISSSRVLYSQLPFLLDEEKGLRLLPLRAKKVIEGESSSYYLENRRNKRGPSLPYDS